MKSSGQRTVDRGQLGFGGALFVAGRGFNRWKKDCLNAILSCGFDDLRKISLKLRRVQMAMGVNP